MLFLFAFTVFVMLVSIKLDRIWQNRQNSLRANCSVTLEDYGDDLIQIAYWESLEMDRAIAEDPSVSKVEDILTRMGSPYCFCENQFDIGAPMDQLH